MIGGHLLDVGDIIGDYDKDINMLIRENNLNYIHHNDATNGFFNISSTKVYHIGYYLMYISFMSLIILYINLLIKINKVNNG